jgi:hypothetical protein
MHATGTSSVMARLEQSRKASLRVISLIHGHGRVGSRHEALLRQARRVAS